MNQNCFDRGRFSFIGLNLALKYHNKTNSKQGMLEGDLNPGEKGSTLHSIEQLRFLTRIFPRLPPRFPLFIESKHGGIMNLVSISFYLAFITFASSVWVACLD